MLESKLLFFCFQSKEEISTLDLCIFQARGCPHIVPTITGEMGGGFVQLWQMWKKMVCIDVPPEEAKLHIQVWWSDIHSTALVFVQQSLLIQSLNSTFHPACFFPFEYLPFVTVWNQNFTAERRNINYVCSSTTDTSPSDDIWSQIWTALLHFSRPPYLHNCQKTFTKDAQTQPFRP